MNLRDRLEQLEPRERRLLTVLAGVFIVMVVLLLPLGLTALLSSQRGDNEELAEAIEQIQQSRDAIQKRHAEQQQVLERYAQTAPPLAAFLARLASEVGLEIPESQDRALVPHGKRYDERSTKITLRRVNMLRLVNFMEKVEQAQHPIVISRLNIRKRGTEVDSYDVELIVSAYDRKGGEGKGRPAGESGAEPGATGDTSDDEEQEL
jgi:general secretion pathway protein M